ncbi:Sigma-70 region 2 [Pseudoflavonifractor capillosus ATCC 29799]|uniref:Sigma-70 region 2 n=1 Tax=Pseudoflavonifractor capillosus ATCC 29799 TaxID=411467 RepID=A6NVQ6_9FIRM|nr:sigma-70 family RNA polymerase sigma factor [Pseudoflavonifractor capillosus]EDM99799.1 Sigma-70 region 2 [Pseudoflavonifractor capillosus ATCC 29799]
MEREEAARLVEAHGQAVYRLAYARTGSREDAEDITQETFLRLVRAAPAFRDEAHCRTWLLHVAMNCTRSLFRRPWRRRDLPLEEAANAAAPDGERGNVLEAVLNLPEQYRAPVHLFYYEDLTVEQIAKILGLREGTVRTRLSRARGMLRDMLKEDEEHA